MKSARTYLRLLAGFTLTTTLALAASAQTSETDKSAAAAAAAKQEHPQRPPYGPTITHVFYLKNLPTQQEATEALIVLRNILDPRDRLTIMPSQNTLVMDAPAEEIAATEKLINDLDKPKRTYRLTYTLIDLDGSKRLGDQHYSMVLVSGQRATLKQGNRVPVVTGAYDKEVKAPTTQITYVDIGMNFDATIEDAPNSLRLKAKVEQSSVVEDRSSALSQDPIIRQSLFEGSAVLTPGKPIILGSLDIAGTTRRLEIQATVEALTP
jgi:type II secretory pathway component GspD/PulD (secretin)